MPLTLATALVAATVTLPACSWDNPGADPYMGDLEAAVDRYRDIPPEVRTKLKDKLRRRDYDDIATITRDTITGRQQYSNLRDMHFGNGRICRQVGRSKWKPEAVERGLVYCAEGHCLIVPTVCRNVSRVTDDGPLEMGSAGGRKEDAEEDEAIDLPSAGGALRGQSFVDASDDPLSSTPRTRTLDPGEPPERSPRPIPSPPQPLPRNEFPLPDPLPPLPPVAPIPEPSRWVLLVMGLAVVARRARLQARTAGPRA